MHGGLDGGPGLDPVGGALHRDEGHVVLDLVQPALEVLAGESVEVAQRLRHPVGYFPLLFAADLFSRQQPAQGERVQVLGQIQLLAGEGPLGAVGYELVPDPVGYHQAALGPQLAVGAVIAHRDGHSRLLVEARGLGGRPLSGCFQDALQVVVLGRGPLVDADHLVVLVHAEFRGQVHGKLHVEKAAGLRCLRQLIRLGLH